MNSQSGRIACVFDMIPLINEMIHIFIPVSHTAYTISCKLFECFLCKLFCWKHKVYECSRITFLVRQTPEGKSVYCLESFFQIILILLIVCNHLRHFSHLGKSYGCTKLTDPVIKTHKFMG